MKCSVNENTKIASIPSDIEEVHIVRPLSHKKIEAILKRCKELRGISMSKSTYKRIARKVLRLFKEKGIEIKIAEERGRAIGIPLEKMMQAIEMRKDFRPLREIEQVTGIPKSTVHYLAKYSLRRKIKRGKTIIYLK